MYSQTQIDPLVSFRNAHGESVRGTLVSLQRKALVMEIYNPDFILQVSEVMHELTVRQGSKVVYNGNALVVSTVNTGLTAVVSLTLIDEWSELRETVLVPGAVGAEAAAFVAGWSERYRIGREYQAVINEMRAFLSDVSRWVDQVDLSDNLPKVNGMLREDLFQELAAPLMAKALTYFGRLEQAAAAVEPELAPAHRAFAQAALHPLILRAPFVFRSFTKPLGYAGDYQMVKQILDDPRQGPSTYFQIVNTLFLQAAVATAHRNRIEVLVDFLQQQAARARALGRPLRILNIGCGPAMEIQRLLDETPDLPPLELELLDFSAETLAWTRSQLEPRVARAGGAVQINYVHESVHQLLKRRPASSAPLERDFDAVYCAGLFDYLSDKVCARLMQYFAQRIRPGGTMLVTNVHTDNPEKYAMEHLLEWHLIYRSEANLAALLPPQAAQRKVYADATGLNVFAEVNIA